MSEAIRTSEAPQPAGFYSQGVKAGPWLFIAGQMAFDNERRLVGKNVGEQTNQTMKNIAAILRAAGGTLAHLTQVTIYITDMAHWPEVNAAYGAFMSQVEVLPARAVVAVKEWGRGALVEIQAIAYLH